MQQIRLDFRNQNGQMLGSFRKRQWGKPMA
jgi:hypothetical protein